ncbi:hypothetical protein GCM10009726_12650 [Nocardioides furvisabuli]|uniref:Uncharacterized protein n=1 Tax=Nocardioides furvisabuli TaxID=375542 RepID=A0ABN2X0J6_9ACTN
MVEVELGVGRVLAGDHEHPSAVGAHRLECLVRTGQRGDRGDRVVGVERPEPVPGRCDLLGQEVGREQVVERRAQPGRHLLQREVHAQLVTQHLQDLPEPGRGVDQGEVEVESDDERGASGHAGERTGRRSPGSTKAPPPARGDGTCVRAGVR